MGQNMKSKSAEPQTVNQNTNNSDCHRESCCLRMKSISNGKECEECLMETVRESWAMPTASNYCKHPSSRRFVDSIHSKMENKDKDKV